jgi:mono/diheme cytochrome c family protein
VNYRRTVVTALLGTALLLAACSKASQSASPAAGAQIYAANCSNCHQANGQGAPGAFPPLAGSEIVAGDATRMIHIVKYGLAGPVAVAGKTYDGQMPAWSPHISDAAIASVITYVRSSWGNRAAAVTAADVTAVTRAGSSP